jgi:transketolase
VLKKIDMRDAFFEYLVQKATHDERIIVLSADHGAFALEKFAKELPDRYINIGISEQNMVSVAAGLALSGKIVFIYGISPFVSLRVLEQLTIDIAAMQLSVNVISVGAGFTYSTDGPTHQGLQDVAAISTIPGMTILNSSDPLNTKSFIDIAISELKPNYIRIEKEKLPEFSRDQKLQFDTSAGYSFLRNSNSKTVLISTGITSHYALAASNYFKESKNLDIDVIDLFRIKPIPDGLIRELYHFAKVIVLEEAYRSVIGLSLAQLILETKLKIDFSVLDCGEKYYFKGASREVMSEIAGMSQTKIIEFIAKKIEVVDAKNQ